MNYGEIILFIRRQLGLYYFSWLFVEVKCDLHIVRLHVNVLLDDTC